MVRARENKNQDVAKTSGYNGIYRGAGPGHSVENLVAVHVIHVVRVIEYYYVIISRSYGYTSPAAPPPQRKARVGRSADGSKVAAVPPEENASAIPRGHHAAPAAVTCCAPEKVLPTVRPFVRPSCRVVTRVLRACAHRSRTGLPPPGTPNETHTRSPRNRRTAVITTVRG